MTRLVRVQRGQRASRGLAANAFATTCVGAAGTTLGWMPIEWYTRGKPTVLGAASGAVAGLVAITPGSGFVTPMGALTSGLVGGVICFYGIRLKEKVHVDDVGGVHCVGGTWGASATGSLACKAVDPAGVDGLFYGDPGQLVSQTSTASEATCWAPSRSDEPENGRAIRLAES